MRKIKNKKLDDKKKVEGENCSRYNFKVIVDVEPQVPLQKKKRGRPKKSQNIVTVVEKDKDLSEVKSTKKQKIEKTDKVITDEPKKKRGRPKKSQNIVTVEKPLKQLKKRKLKNEKKSVDKVKKVGEDLDLKKPPVVFDDDFNFKEGAKRKRKRRAKADIPIYPDFTFSDSIDVIGGDARIDFNQAVDDEFKDGKFIWCPKNDFRMIAKMCGRYVTPKCKKRIRCELFEYGMGVRSRYGLKAYVDSEPKKKVVVVETNDESLENGE